MDKIKKLVNELGPDEFRNKLMDPLFFINEIMGAGDNGKGKLTTYQKDWVRLVEEHDRLNIMAFRSSGKSQTFFIDYPIYKAFTCPGWQGILVSSSQKQSISLLRRIREKILGNELLRTSVPTGRDGLWSKTELQLKNGSIIWSRPNSENLAGEHVDFIGGDEIGYWKDENIIKKVIPPMVRSKQGKLVFVGTPTSEMDMIHELRKNKAFASRKFAASDIHNVEGRTLWDLRYPTTPMEKAKLEFDSLSWSREYECLPLSSNDKIYPYELISRGFDLKAAFTNERDTHSAYFIGMDFALSGEAGSDFTVFSVIQKKGDKSRLVFMERFKGMSYELQKKRAVALNTIFTPRQVIVDEGNFGKAFLQDLLNMHVPAVGFRFTNESKQNLHTNLRNMFEQNRMIINRLESDNRTKMVTDQLLKEMDKFGVVVDKGTIKLMGLGEHDDMVSSLALAAWGARSVGGMSWKIGRGVGQSSGGSGMVFLGRVN